MDSPTDALTAGIEFLGGRPPPAPGVYVVKFAGGWVYCGASSASVHKRVRGHLSKLRRGVHPNPRFQAAWDECGGVGVCVSCRALAESSLADLLASETELLKHWQRRGAHRLLNVACASLRPCRPIPSSHHPTPFSASAASSSAAVVEHRSE